MVIIIIENGTIQEIRSTEEYIIIDFDSDHPYEDLLGHLESKLEEDEMLDNLLMLMEKNDD